MKEKATVLVVEDELITAESIAELLTEEEYKIAGIAKDAASAFRICTEAEELPQVVICDINIKGEMKGTALAKELKETHGCEIIFITAYSDSKTLTAAFEADPAMYVMKPYSDTQLLVAVQLAFHKVFRKQNVQVSSKLMLTEREKEIAQLVANGFSSKQIARKLSISIETVKTHRRRMLQKNNVSSFPHLVFLMNQDA
jgi:DNA-binding NarL/FixJ family response regulator